MSALHKRIRHALCLDALGFVPEQWVEHYRCDDVHRKRRIVVEVNGDYVHANPRIYAPETVIVLESQRFTAQERWAADEKRRRTIKAAGYCVLTVWESDDIDAATAALWALLRES